jgi:hypothetical protein
MTARDHEDDDRPGIPLFDMEPTAQDRIYNPPRQAPSTSLVSFLLVVGLLTFGGLAALNAWKEGQPVYSKVREAHRAHVKQVHYPSGSAVNESDLVRPLFARNGDKFDLVASIYYVNYGVSYWSNKAVDQEGQENATAIEPTGPEWQRLFSKPVLRELDATSTVDTVVKVILPATIA